MKNWLNGEAAKIAEGTKVKYKSFFKKSLQVGYVEYDGGGDYLLLSDSLCDCGCFSVARSDIVRICRR